jgi:hypothetical protein
MPNINKPWEKYNLTSVNQIEFEEVFHVTHLDIAIKILQDKKIRPSLIRDESILNSDRIEVNWLSPNHWPIGYRYGNVRFKFYFKELVEDRNIYWVEEMDAYSPTTPCAIGK